MIRSLRTENGSLRGLSGSGEPGLFTLLGGTSPELDSSGYTTVGGPGQVSATTRLALAYRDKRLAAVSAGVTAGRGGPSGGPGRNPFNPIEGPYFPRTGRYG